MPEPDEGLLVHQLVSRRAAHTPQAIAACYRDVRLSYAELDRRANQLAHLLRGRGAGPEQAVGVHLPRGLDHLVAVLGVLKAGAAYMPLDPANPASRLRRMIEGAGALLVVSRADQPALAPVRPAELILLETARTADHPVEAPRVRVTGRNLAYVIHTSGSTGAPKGVMVEHAALSRRAGWMRRTYQLLPSDRVTVLASPGFDLSVMELWPALTAGARLCIPAAETRASVRDLQAWLLAEGATVALPPTQVAELLVRLPWPAGSSLRLVLTGGDRLRARPAPDASFVLVNGYGPTENTVFSTCGPVEPAARDGAPAPSIGRAIDETAVWILQDEQRPAPDGSAGELYLGGPGLARGYIGSPAETALRFVPDPRATAPGARLYRTGDRVRRLPDGELEFGGRLDAQVKISGHRVEPAEVEAALTSHALVAAAHVRADVGNARLDAFVVPRDARRVPAAEQLRAHVSRLLPAWMVPWRCIVLDALPVTPSGKVDARALADLAGSMPHRPPAPPRPAATGVERRLIRIWRDVFRQDDIDTDADFFRLGGHSLSANLIVARIRDAFGVDLSVHDFFANPTVGTLADLVERRTPDQGRRSGPVIPGDAGSERGVLSTQQEQVWLLDRLASTPDELAYLWSMTIRVQGRLDVDLVERALTEITRRHEILRTTYVELAGRPAPVVHAPEAVHVERVDLRHLPRPQAEARSEEIVWREARRPFSLTQLPLMRWTAIHLAPDEHELLAVQHHVVHDGWSDSVLLHELEELYNAFASGRPARLDDLPIQYADYARRQRAALGTRPMRRQLEFWRARLAGMPREVGLHPDRPRDGRQTFRGDLLRVELPPTLPGALRRFCREERVTLFAALFAAFAALLHRHTAQTDVCVGSAYANRLEGETRALIGMLVNTVVLRCAVSPADSFGSLARRAQDVIQEAAANQEYPFSRLVEALGVERDAARNPLVQIMFNCHDSPVREPVLDGASTTIFERSNGSAKFDLGVTAVPKMRRLRQDPAHLDDRIALLWEYNVDLFDRTTMQRMVEHYVRLLGAAVAEPERPVSRLPMLGETEREQVLGDWGTGSREPASDLAVHELFARQARSTPRAVAVVFGDEELTYGELHSRVDRLAGRLRGAGAGPDGLVGVCLERSIELVVAIMAVLSAGAAYVPLDPADPPDRLARLVRDTPLVAVVTRGEHVGLLPADGPRLIDVGQLEVGGVPRDHAPVPARPENLAYVMHTSGSTGEPLAVAVTHRGLCERLAWAREHLGLAPGERGMLKAPITFDMSVSEMLWPLLTGGALVVAAPGRHRDPDYVADLAAQREVTALHVVPPMLALLVEQARLDRCAALKRVVSGGEVLASALCARFARGSAAELFNLYGPTEASMFATAWRCRPEEPGPAAPIGRPVTGAEVYILDASLEPVPVGTPGQVYLGGAGLARGYHGRPAITADRFVPHPFSARPGARLYRTGDVARWRADGVIDFLGRVDEQVKIRGHRVEPDEIATLLALHPDLAAAHVTPANEPATGERRLVAHVVPRREGHVPGVHELQEFLAHRLPSYMVPSAFVALDALPLRPSGKVDQRALADRGTPIRRTAPGGLQAGLETELGSIWCQVLGVEAVGSADNFFDVGGNSLLVVQVHHRLAHELGHDVPLMALFEHPTIRSLARHLGGDGRDAAAPPPRPPQVGVRDTGAARWRERSRGLRSAERASRRGRVDGDRRRLP